jgi:hypothetical protein
MSNQAEFWFWPMLMNWRQGSEQATTMLPLELQPKVTPAPVALIPALLPRRTKNGCSSFPQPSQTIVIGIEVYSPQNYRATYIEILSDLDDANGLNCRLSS